MPQARPIEIKPASGGKLMYSLSSEAAGLSNYHIKRDFRRCYDREIRAEGHDALYQYNPALTQVQILPLLLASDVDVALPTFDKDCF